MTLDDFFLGFEGSRILFDVLQREIQTLGAFEIIVTKSQVAFSSGNAFAWGWIPGRYLRRDCAPLVLTLSFRQRDPSPRWKQVVEPAPGRYIHHLELYETGDIDDEVRAWLKKARHETGQPVNRL